MPGLSELLGLQPPVGTGLGLNPYGMRHDGSAPKGKGYFGPLQGPNGVSTEISVGMNLGGREMEVPALVPTLTPQEIQHLLSGGPMTNEILQKARMHAQGRLQANQSPFASGGLYATPGMLGLAGLLSRPR